jgi:hypothetical protein
MWRFPIAMVGLSSGCALFLFSLSNRWVNWCRDKPFAIPYFVLAVALWSFVAGVELLRAMVAPR